MHAWRTGLAQQMMAWAGRIMPADQGEWAKAMAEELPHIESGPATLRFVTGCLRAAAGQRAAAIARAPEVAAGVLAGSFFVVHGAVPDSQSWPWMWPLLCGVLVALGPATFSRSAGPLSTLKSAAMAGAVCGLLFFTGAALLITAGSLIIEDAPSLASRLGLLLWGGGGAIIVSTFGAFAARLMKNLAQRI